MLQCRTDRRLVSPEPEWKKMLMPEPFWYRNTETQSGAGMLRYGTEMIDAGPPMPVASALMPMPSYDEMWTKPFMTPVFDCRFYKMLQDSQMREIGDLCNAIFQSFWHLYIAIQYC